MFDDDDEAKEDEYDKDDIEYDYNEGHVADEDDVDGEEDKEDVDDEDDKDDVDDEHDVDGEDAEDDEDDVDDVITLQGRRQLHVVARCSVAASYSPALLTLPATK